MFRWWYRSQLVFSANNSDDLSGGWRAAGPQDSNIWPAGYLRKLKTLTSINTTLLNMNANKIIKKYE